MSTVRNGGRQAGQHLATILAISLRNGGDRIDILKLKETMTQEELAEHLGMTRAQVCHALRRARKSERIEYEDKRETTDEDIDKFIDAMKNLQDAQDGVNTKQVRASVRLNESKPFAVVFSGDWHVGAQGVDYKTLESHIDLIAETDGMYFIGAGDYIDNAILHKGSDFESIIRPGMQMKAAARFMERIGDKVLALIRGCHEDFSKKVDDRDYLEELCQLTDSINLWHGGDILIKAGSQEYLWRCRHKYKFQSSLNLENAMRRIMEVKGPCDVAAEAHYHDGYIMDRHMMGEFRIMLRSGSYKVWDEFGQKLAGYKGHPMMPVVIMWPDRKEMLPIKDINVAAQVLNGLR